MLDQKPKSTSEVTSFVTFRLAQVQNRLNAQASHLLREGAGITLVEWRIIMLLQLLSDATLTDLAEAVMMDKGQLSRKITSMTEKGLVKATPNDKDQRKLTLHLTAKAHHISEAMFPIMQKRQKHLIGGISEQDLKAFFDVLEKVERATEKRDFL